MSRPRLLLAITVYNGRDFVPRCLQAARRLRQERADIDVLVLDDASPEPGFSREVAGLCARLGFVHYRSPRNLGIVRNVNLGMLAAVRGGYDHLVISNSDVVYGADAIDLMVLAAEADPSIGSVTAWSNNVSLYSAPNTCTDETLADVDLVDWLCVCLSRDYRGIAIDVPAGISFSMLIPASVIKKVGLMDPVFGRGYCEETDWSLRSLAAGHRVTLAPAAFVYHRGRGSTAAAGMLRGDGSTVPENEAVIDLRYPLFRDQVDTFAHGGILTRLHADAQVRIVRDAMRQFGHVCRIGVPGEPPPKRQVQVQWRPQRPTVAVASFCGFSTPIPLRGLSLARAVDTFVASHGPVEPPPPPRKPAAAAPVSPGAAHLMYPSHV